MKLKDDPGNSTVINKFIDKTRRLKYRDEKQWKLRARCSLASFQHLRQPTDTSDQLQKQSCEYFL